MKIKNLFTALATLLVCSCVFAAPSAPPRLRLHYDKPATEWMTEALPVGNGEIGAMFFGGPAQEHIQFNDKTLWEGSHTMRGSFQNFGDILINFDLPAGEISSYNRELDIENAVGKVEFSIGKASFTREIIASNPDSVIAMRLTQKGDPKGLNFTLTLTDGRDVKTVYNGAEASFQNKLTLLDYMAKVKVVADRGTVTSSDSCITVKGAKSATILLAMGTNYSPTSETYTRCDAKQLAALIDRTISRASKMPFAKLKTRHLADYKALFNRLSLYIPETDGKDYTGVTTDLLIKEHRDCNFIDELYYQYGRYLTIASSRGTALPSNLQGLWSNTNTPPWEADIHTDINVQMNYWPVESANLSECHLPFLNYIKSEAYDREDNAWKELAKNEGCRGWTVCCQCNIFGQTDWLINRPANAWYCTHLWQHYAYTNDLDYLANTAFPVMKSTCEFWFDRLKPDAEGKLIAPDEWSPEHGPFCDGVAYSQQLIWQLFKETSNAIAAMQAAGIDVDQQFADELSDKFGRLDGGLWIGDWGQLKEWLDDKENLDYQGADHRHISHLIALYPGDQIDAVNDKDFAQAAAVALNSRGEQGTGWSRAWKIACWARLLDGDHALRLLKSALTPSHITYVSMNSADGGVYPNMFDSHPSFQIDGNFGACAAISEMLLQSHHGRQHLLPAIPAAWPSGKVNGIKGQDGFVWSIEWADGKPVSATVESLFGQECTVMAAAPMTLKSAPNLRSEKSGDYYRISFPTAPGKKYRLQF